MADAELAFALTLRDEATDLARSARRTLDGLGGATSPIETAVIVDASQVARAATQAAAGATEIRTEIEGSLDGVRGTLGAEASRVGDAIGDGVTDGVGDADPAAPIEENLLGGKAKLVAAAAAVAVAMGAALMGGLSDAMDQEVAVDRLNASIGSTPAEAARIGKVAGDLYAGAWGESMDDVTMAVGAVKSSFSGLASDASLAKVSAQAMDFATIFEVDVVRAAATAGNVVKTGLAKNATQAFDLMTAASQKVPAHLREDVLDAADEYGQFFKGLGYDGEAAFATLVKGSAKGMYGIDKAGDAIKEFTIRATDMSTSSKDAYKAIGLDAQTMANQILAGGGKAQGATQKIIRGLLSIKNPATQANTAIALFGTPLEDLNVKDIPAFLRTLQTSKKGLGEWEGSIDSAGATLNDNARTNLTSFTRSVKQGLVDLIGGSVLPVVNDLARTLASDLGPAFRTAGSAAGAVVGFLREHSTTAKTLAAVVLTLAVVTGAHAVAMAAAAAGGFGAWIAQLLRASAIGKAYAAVQWAINAAVAANPFVLIVIAIVAVVAVLVLLFKKNETFRNAVLAVWNAVKVGVVAAVNMIRTAVAAAWEWIRAKSAAVWSVIGGAVMGAWRLISTAVRTYINVVRTIITVAFKVIATVIRTYVNVWRTVISVAWRVISTVVRTAIAVVRTVVVGGFNAVRSAISSAMGAAKSLVSAAWAAVARFFTSGVARVTGIAKGLVAKVKSSLSGMYSMATGIGKDIIRGMVSGVTSMASSLATATKNAASGALNGAKSLLGIKSPSREFKKVGKWSMDGFVLGILGGRAAVDKAIDKTFGSLDAYYKKKFGKNKRAATAASAWARRMLADDVAAIRKNADSRDQWLARLGEQAARAADITKSMIDASGITSVDTVNDAPMTAGFLAQGLADRLAAIKAYRADLATLRKRGVSAQYVNELEDKGYETGGAIARALATGTAAQLAEIEKSRTAIAAQAKAVGTEATAGVVKGIEAQLAQITRVGKNLARALLTAIRKELKIKSPSRVTAEDGRQVVAGMASGIRANVGTAEREAAGMARRVAAAAHVDAGTLSQLANAASTSTLIRTSEVVTIRHEVVSPDGSLDELTAQEVADLLVRDPRSARRLEAALATQRGRRKANTLAASDE